MNRYADITDKTTRIVEIVAQKSGEQRQHALSRFEKAYPGIAAELSEDVAADSFGKFLQKEHMKNVRPVPLNAQHHEGMWAQLQEKLSIAEMLDIGTPVYFGDVVRQLSQNKNAAQLYNMLHNTIRNWFSPLQTLGNTDSDGKYIFAQIRRIKADILGEKSKLTSQKHKFSGFKIWAKSDTNKRIEMIPTFCQINDNALSLKLKAAMSQQFRNQKYVEITVQDDRMNLVLGNFPVVNETVNLKMEY